MPHLDEGTLHALLDGEVPSAEMTAVQAHLLGCVECRSRLEEARAFREESFGMLAALDEDRIESVRELAMALPMPDPAALMMEASPMTGSAPMAEGGPTPRVRVTEPRPEPRRRIVPAWATPVAWAATIALAVGIGYRMSGSTADQAIPPADGRAAAKTEPTAAPAPTGDSAAPLAGIAAPPSAETRQAAPPPTPSAAAGAAARSRVQAVEKKAADARPRQEETKEPGRAADQPDPESAKPAPPPANAAADPDRPAAAPVPRRALRRDQTLSLQEVVVTGEPAPGTVRALDADGAIRALGGSIRLIDGLTPTRYTQLGDTVRVEYPTSFGPIILEQWRADNALRHRLRAPAGAPGDSISAWEERIR